MNKNKLILEHHQDTVKSYDEDHVLLSQKKFKDNLMRFRELLLWESPSVPDKISK